MGKHLEFSFEEIAGCSHLDVVCKYFDPHNLPIEDQVIVRDYIFQIAISICANIIQFKDLEGDLEILFRDQKAFERSAAFTTTIGTLSNVLGNKPKMKLELWSDDRAKMYPLLRTKPWKPIIRKSASHDKDELESARKEPNSIRHSQIDLFLYKE